MSTHCIDYLTGILKYLVQTLKWLLGDLRCQRTEKEERRGRKGGEWNKRIEKDINYIALRKLDSRGERATQGAGSGKKGEKEHQNQDPKEEDCLVTVES
jgi:hypothetical protein